MASIKSAVTASVANIISGHGLRLERAMMKDEAVAHGGALDEARLRYPFAPEPWIDLSTGVNAIPYPLPPAPSELWARLPFAREDFELRQAAAIRYRAASVETIVAAPGTQALIQILPRLISRTRVAVLSPTYAEHGAAWKREGHSICEIATLADAPADVKAIIVINPNNPTGRIIPVEDLLRKAHELNRHQGFLVVDEAFMDVIEPSQSIIPDLPPATVVLRSFGKMYGLAGLRLGFAVADRKIASRLRDLLGPWAVSGPAMAIARTALADDAWLAQAKHRLTLDAERLDALLARAQCQAVGGTPLFRLAAHPSADAIAQKLGERGILARLFSYEPRWLRFGIPGCEEAWRRLEQALCS
jgi:cobalamin biosynthesis protein CobC